MLSNIFKPLVHIRKRVLIRAIIDAYHGVGTIKVRPSHITELLSTCSIPNFQPCGFVANCHNLVIHRTTYGRLLLGFKLILYESLAYARLAYATITADDNLEQIVIVVISLISHF